MNKAGGWTHEQIAILLERYPQERAKDVAERIGRTKQAVDHMASRMKIGKCPEAMYAIKSKAMKRESSGNFKGYRRKTKKGYILLLLPEETGASKHGLIMEHRHVMAQHIGRPITAQEAVHHINGITTDNRIENLQLMTVGQHSTLHNTGKSRKKAV